MKKEFMNKKKTRIPPLRLPDPTELRPPPGCTAYDEPPIPIRYVKHKDWHALFINLISAVIFFIVLSVAFSFISNSTLMTKWFPVAIIFFTTFLILHRLGTNVAGRSAEIYLDNIFSNETIVYTQGFHFTTWCSTKQPDVVSFQKHETVEASKAARTEIKFQSKDGFEMFSEFFVLHKRKDLEDALSMSLKYQITEINDLTLAVISARISDLGGLNSAQTLLAHKNEVMAWVANLFGGKLNTSPFERRMGTEIDDPVLKTLGMTEESAKTFGVKAKIQIIAEGVETLTGIHQGITPDEALLAAQSAEGVITRQVNTYQGIPQGASVVALGDSGIAIAAKKGK